MHYNVPQFIDVEDAIVGPLTAKQLLWLFGLGAALFIIWFIFDDKVTFFIVAIPVSILFLGLAFYRPYGFPLSKFIGSMFMFFVKPKVYMWKRTGKVADERKAYEKESPIVKTPAKRLLKEKEIYDIAKILDSEADILKEINKK